MADAEQKQEEFTGVLEAISEPKELKGGRQKHTVTFSCDGEEVLVEAFHDKVGELVVGSNYEVRTSANRTNDGGWFRPTISAVRPIGNAVPKATKEEIPEERKPPPPQPKAPPVQQSQIQQSQTSVSRVPQGDRWREYQLRTRHAQDHTTRRIELLVQLEIAGKLDEPSGMSSVEGFVRVLRFLHETYNELDDQTLAEDAFGTFSGND